MTLQCKLSLLGHMLRGENIFRTWSGKSAEEDSLVKIASEIWYQEIKLHRYPGDAKGYAECKSVDPFEVGYFTQMMWPSTKRVGCGTETCRQLQVVVRQYDPPGNFNTKPLFTPESLNLIKENGEKIQQC